MFIDDDGVIQRPFLRTRYNYDMDKTSEELGLFCTDETRTQQQFKEECDINTIVKNFGLTGELPANVKMPLSEDFLEVTDYQEALNKLIEADRKFMEFPAEIRAQFENDPGKFVTFVENPENVDQCRKWGLAVPERKAVEPLSVRVIAEDPGAGTGFPMSKA